MCVLNVALGPVSSESLQKASISSGFDEMAESFASRCAVHQ